MEELIEFIKLIWNLRTIIIIAIVGLVLFMFYDKVLGVVAHHKEVFGKGGKKDD